MNKNIFENKKLISLRLLPPIFLALASLGYSFVYLDSRYSTRFNFLQAGGYFGIALLLLFLDIALEYFYKDKGKTYHYLSITISVITLAYYAVAALTYFQQLDSSAEPRYRIFPCVLLVILLFVNVFYRLLTMLGKWDTEERKGHDLFAAYIGFLGLGLSLLNSFPFSAILIYGNNIQFSYIGIFADLALAVSFVETLLGIAWLSFEKVRSTIKSNIFFYATVFSFFTTLAALIVAAFGYSYAMIDLVTGNWCFAMFTISIVSTGAGLLYLSYLTKK